MLRRSPRAKANTRITTKNFFQSRQGDEWKDITGTEGGREGKMEVSLQ